MKKRESNLDYTLIAIVLILLLWGILILAGVSAVSSQIKTGTPNYYLLRHVLFGGFLGSIACLVAFKLKLSFLKKWSWVLLLISLFLMILAFIPGIGIRAGGAYRWINLGFATFQPSELLKITFILYLSAWLSGRSSLSYNLKGKKKDSPVFIPFLVVFASVCALLFLQSDVSTLGVIAFIAIVMYFSANNPIWQTALVSLAIIGLLLLVAFAAPYRVGRIKILLNMQEDSAGIGYQIKQSLITVGSGGIFGLGLGSSNQKFGILPQTMGDSIFPIIAEETGFVGAAFLVLLFLAFLWRSLSIAKKSDNMFMSLFVIGIGTWICLQAFINIGSMIGIFPVTGIPLPFISYGGSHMLAELTAVGLLLNVSKSRERW